MRRRNFCTNAEIVRLHGVACGTHFNGLPTMRIHEIRHTFAVRAMEIPEFDIKSLSEILGDKNVSFTLNVYGRANLQQKTKCMNLLNDLL